MKTKNIKINDTVFILKDGYIFKTRVFDVLLYSVRSDSNKENHYCLEYRNKDNYPATCIRTEDEIFFSIDELFDNLQEEYDKRTVSAGSSI